MEAAIRAGSCPWEEATESGPPSRYSVVQLFAGVCDTDAQGNVSSSREGYVRAREMGKPYGRPGGAWAARREAIRHGLYDPHIIGGGDTALVHAWEEQEWEPHRFGDLVLQIEARTRAKLVNGGVFFRGIPGDFLNGYEVQVFHACYDGDPAKPARYSTGAIDDRQLARRLVSRDKVPFVMTVIAAGPHIATWVNGHQMTDWTDTREPNENARQGLRLEPGAVQLQAHDRDTNIEFRRILAATLE